LANDMWRVFDIRGSYTTSFTDDHGLEAAQAVIHSRGQDVPPGGVAAARNGEREVPGEKFPGAFLEMDVEDPGLGRRMQELGWDVALVDVEDDTQFAIALERANSGGFGAAGVGVPPGSFCKSHRRQLRGNGCPGGLPVAQLSKTDRAKVQRENARVRRQMELLEVVERRGGGTGCYGPRDSWWWELSAVRRWSGAGCRKSARVDLCSWQEDRAERMWVGSFTGLEEMSESCRCTHEPEEHRRRHVVPGVAAPKGLRCLQAAKIEEWFEGPRVVPSGTKPRAWARTPWEHRLGELVEVLPFQKVMAWRDRSGATINRLELKARNKVIRRHSRRPKKHHKRILTVGDSRATSGAAAKARSSADSMNSSLKMVVPDFLGGDLSSSTGWCESARCTADEPSRKREVLGPARPTPEEMEILEGRIPMVSREVEKDWRSGRWNPRPRAPLRRVVSYSSHLLMMGAGAATTGAGAVSTAASEEA